MSQEAKQCSKCKFFWCEHQQHQDRKLMADFHDEKDITEKVDWLDGNVATSCAKDCKDAIESRQIFETGGGSVKPAA